ncbi:MAG: hypothetical protein R2731_01965 [Nocardioides sp.]
MTEMVLPVRGAAPYDVVVGRDLAACLPALLGEGGVHRVAVVHDERLIDQAAPILEVLDAF